MGDSVITLKPIVPTNSIDRAYVFRVECPDLALLADKKKEWYKLLRSQGFDVKIEKSSYNEV